jgi:GTP pyrophosphokinase
VKEMKVSDFLGKILKDFFRKVEESNLNNFGKNLVKKAVYFAVVAHDGQKRVSGEEFVFHPIAVGELLLEIGQPAEVIVAGILHDVAEDTKVTLAEIEKDFGPEIAFLVDGMTKIFTSYHVDEIEKIFGPQVVLVVKEIIGSGDVSLVDEDIIYRAKLIVFARKDYRVVFIRLADRLHNTRTLEFLPILKQESVAKETLEFHIPLVREFIPEEKREVISSWLKELESLSGKYLHPNSRVAVIKRSIALCLVK